MSLPTSEPKRRARTYRINPTRYSPDSLLPVDEEFAELCVAVTNEGIEAAKDMRTCFVGMARQIGGVLPFSLARLKAIGEMFSDWCAVVVENDSTDRTKEVLLEWEEQNAGRVIADCRDLGREKLSGFERSRVERYAEYRTRYRDIAADHFPDCDLVIAVDLDPWGGWSELGVLNGVGWMDRLPKAAGMASVSIYEQAVGTEQEPKSLLCHYDHWAYRSAGWKQRWEQHFALWLPPVGSPPIRCNSAFGAMCLYRPDAFFAHAPASIDGDIEHVGLHRAMADAGWEFYLNPAQRVLMHWVPGDDEVLPDGA